MTVVGPVITDSFSGVTEAEKCCLEGDENSDADLLMACNMETMIAPSTFSWDKIDMKCTETFDVMTTTLNPSDNTQVGDVVTTTMNQMATAD